MWKASLPSKLLIQYSSSSSSSSSSSRRLPSSATMNNNTPPQVGSFRDDTDLRVSTVNDESSSRRLSLRRLSLPTVSRRPQWGKRLQHCMSRRVIKQRKNLNQTTDADGRGHSLSLTNSSEEDSSIKSNMSTASSSSSTSLELSMKQHPRSVRFSVVQVREFSRTVGENPACKAGPPLTLDWFFVELPEERLFDLSNHDDDDEDSTKNDKQTTKRTLQQLHVSAERRMAMLRDEWDVTESELAASMIVVEQIKKSREQVVAEFRQLLALRRQQQQEQTKVTQNEKDGSNAEFLVTRVEC